MMEYVEIDTVLDLNEGKSIGKILAEEYDKAIAEDIVKVIKKYFPNTTLNEKKVIMFVKMLMDNEKGR